MRLHNYPIVALLALLPFAGCNSNNANNANNAAAGEPHPTANELDKALERRPKLDDDKNREDRKKREPKTWIGRAVLGVMSDGGGISAEEQDKLRDYIMANDEFLSQHMEPPKQAILRANQRPAAIRVHDVPKQPDGKPGDMPKSPDRNSQDPKQPPVPAAGDGAR